jgi:cytochrome c5
MQMTAITTRSLTATALQDKAWRRKRFLWLAAYVCVFLPFGLLAASGCLNTPADNSERAQGPAPLRMPSPAREEGASHSYEDSLTGGKVFTMYCSYCHNAPALAERPFSNFKNVAAHMRVQANLTGKEYAKVMEFMQRWNDVPPPNPPPEPSPKRLIFSQPINELRPELPVNLVPPDGQPKDGKNP